MNTPSDNLSSTPSVIPPRLVRRYMNQEIWSAVIWLVFGSVWGGAIFAGLLLALRLNEVQIGWAMSIGLLFLPMQALGSMIQRRFFNRKRFWTICVLLHYSCFGAIGILAALWLKIPHEWAVVFFFLLYASSNCCAQLGGAVGTAWLGDVIPPRESSAFWSRRGGVTLVCSTIIGVAMGKVVDMLGQGALSTYAIVATGGALFGLASMLPRLAIVDPAPEPVGEESPWKTLGAVWSDTGFRRLVAFFATQSLVWWCWGAFYFIYLQRDMKFSMTAIQILMAISCTSGGIGAFFFKVVGAKYGNKPIFILCCIGKCFEFFFYASLLPGNGFLDVAGEHVLRMVCALWHGVPPELPAGVLSAVPTFILGGFFNVGLGAAQSSTLTTLGDGRSRAAMIGIFWSVMGVVGFVASSQSGVLYDFMAAQPIFTETRFSPVNLLAVVTGIGFLLSTLWLIGFRDRKQVSTMSAMRALCSANPIRAIYQAGVLAGPMRENERFKTLQKAHGALFSNEVLGALYSPSSRIRDGAMLNLSASSELPPAELGDELIKMIEIPELGMQAMAARTVGRLNLTAGLPVLIRHFRDDDVTLAQSCIFSAGLLGDPAAEPALRAILEDRRATLLWPLAAEALSRLPVPEDAGLIFKVLTNERYWTLRQQTLISLVRIMQRDKSAAHKSFENEEHFPGAEIELLIQQIAIFPDAPEAAPLLDHVDAGRWAVVLVAVLEFETGKRPAPEPGSPGAVNLGIQKMLCDGLVSGADGSDRFWLLTGLLLAREVLGDPAD